MNEMAEPTAFGVIYCTIREILKFNDSKKLIIIGTVLSIFRDDKFFSLKISDGTCLCEATYYFPKSDHQLLPIPNLGDTIQALITFPVKFLVGPKGPIPKLRLNRWRALNIDQELELRQKISVSRNARLVKSELEGMLEIKKKVPIKEKVFTELQMVDVRSIIFSYTYIVLKNNKDLNSLLFAALMIRQHSVCKDYVKQHNVPEKSMDEALKRGISYLANNGIIQLKPPEASEISLNNPDQYIIKRRYFERLVVDIEEFIFDRKTKGGATLELVTREMNDRMGKYNDTDCLFNWKFIQKVLRDLIDDHRIYKTNEKKLFPFNT